MNSVGQSLGRRSFNLLRKFLARNFDSVIGVDIAIHVACVDGE